MKKHIEEKTEHKYVPAGTGYQGESVLTVRNTALSIVAFCMLVTILLILMAPKPVMGFRGEPNGVYGIKWGTRFSDMPESFKNAFTIRVDRDKDGVMMYALDPKVAKIPGGGNEIGFIFLNDQFISVVVGFDSQRDAWGFIIASVEMYGDPTGTMPITNGSIISWKGKVSSIIVAESPGHNFVTIGNTPKLLEYGETLSGRRRGKEPKVERNEEEKLSI